MPTPRWRLLPHDGPADGSDATAALADFAAAVRDQARERGQLGRRVSIVEDRAQLAAAVAPARKYHGQVIVEDYIAGTEVFVGILDGRVLGSVEVRPATKFYDYEAKYKRTDTKYLIPPELPRRRDRARRAARARRVQRARLQRPRAARSADLDRRRRVRARGQHAARA